ncbi:MAG: alpha/beta hydrolase [Rhodospirillales bacterium]
MQQVLLTAVGAYALVIVSLYVFQRNLMYHTDADLVPPSDTQLAHAQIHHLQSEPGIDVQSWYLPGKEGMPVIVFFHGNAGTIADRDFKAAPWHAAGYGVWLTGYRGFGSNAGSPTEQGLYADARAAIEQLKREGVDPADMVFYGESLGSGVATNMAYELARSGTPVRNLILEAPFTSMGAAAQFRHPYVPARWLVRDRYDNLSKITQISAPLLVIHGDNDKVLPQQFGRELYAAAKEPKKAMWIDGGGHTDLFDYGVGQAVLDYLDELG